METREWTGLHDRSDWAPGPWDAEPDKVQWTDEATGLPCIARRGGVPAWCGYVGVPAGHPWHGVHGEALDDVAPSHCGLTYADGCQGGEEGICHVPAPGEADDVWWLGFDCGHSGDTWPGFGWFPTMGEYRTLAYVKGRVAELAAAVAAAGVPRG